MITIYIILVLVLAIIFTCLEVSASKELKTPVTLGDVFLILFSSIVFPIGLYVLISMLNHHFSDIKITDIIVYNPNKKEKK